MGQRSFKSLTPAGQRVRIARDVLNQLKGDNFHAGGGYLTLEFNPGFDRGAPLKPQLDNAWSCQACAIGAMFVSSVRMANHVSANDLNLDCGWGNAMIHADRDDVADRLKSCGNFTVAQLHLIETAFELMEIVDRPSRVKEDDVDDAVAFGKPYRDKQSRMEAIMKNIVRNRGEFVPSDTRKGA